MTQARRLMKLNTTQSRSVVVTLGAAALAAGVAGCGRPAANERASPAPPESAQSATAHPTKGPHGGDLIELGDEAYHAELVHDNAAGEVTIHVLDSAAKASVPIDAETVTVNISHDRSAEQFELPAVDGAGQSSRFVSTDAALAEELNHQHAQAELVVAINGKQYRGVLRHDHEH